MHSQRQQRLKLLFSLLLVAAAATPATAATAARTTATAATAASGLATKPLAPPAADSICSRSKHVVLASFGEPDEYHTVSLYFASKFPNASVHHLWLHLGDKTEEEDDDAFDDDATDTAKKATSTTAALRWQLLKQRAAVLKMKKSRQHKSPVDWRAFYCSHGIHRSVVDMDSLDAYQKLRATYLHSSINGYEYELLCFARFIGLHDFCSSKGIEQLTWIDADIPIFDADFLNRVCLPRGYSVWALTSGSSFLNTMTCSEIGRFVDFMLDFYAKENRHALVRAIHAHGSNNMDGAEGISEKVRQAEPAFAELGIDPKHFSDMFLFSKFLQDTNAIAAKAIAAKVARENEHGKQGEKDATPLSAAAPRNPREPKKAYIRHDENGGTIDPYFVPILSMRDSVPGPDRERLCMNETVWNQYYSLRSSGVGEDKREPAARETNHTRLGLAFNESGTWARISGAHFQGNDCKARLLSAFSDEISKRARLFGDESRPGRARRACCAALANEARRGVFRDHPVSSLWSKPCTF